MGNDSVFHQGDLFITRFRSTKSGHLVLFMDNGENAFRMLPYAAFEKDDDVKIEANQWYSFFDLSAVPYKDRQTVDELELMTDQNTMSYVFITFSRKLLLQKISSLT